jgi:hypothetical protein
MGDLPIHVFRRVQFVTLESSFVFGDSFEIHHAQVSPSAHFLITCVTLLVFVWKSLTWYRFPRYPFGFLCLKGYMSEAQKKALMVGNSANEWTKNSLGVDIADTVGVVVDTVRDRVGGGPARSGYGAVSLQSPNEHDEPSGLYNPDDDDLFTEYHDRGQSALNGGNSVSGKETTKTTTNNTKKSDWDVGQSLLNA